MTPHTNLWHLPLLTPAIFGFLLGCSPLMVVAAQLAAPPAWLQQQIVEFQQAPVANPPTVIRQYQLNGETVYYIPARCCDIASVLYNAKGQLLCSPDGGFTGRGDGRCPTAHQQLQEEVIIWQDPRPHQPPSVTQ